MIVGKVVRSVGFGIYKDMSRIKTAIAIEIVKNISNKADGSGTIIIASIPITKNTTPISLFASKKFSERPACCLSVSFFAKMLL